MRQHESRPEHPEYTGRYDEGCCLPGHHGIIGFVEVQLGRASTETVDELREGLPQHENVWFLMHEVTVRPRTPPNNSDIAPFSYFPSNDLQGVLRNIDGEVRIIKPEWTEEIPAMGPNHFPLALQGANFEELVQLVREIAES